ncbi:MAG: type II toxin-antitoxin system VapC family toxin [Bryobacteraceae bacterium]
MSDLVIDASLTLQWFLEDEIGREYSLAVLQTLPGRRAFVPPLYFYEVGNGLIMAYRRKRITSEQVFGFLVRLKELPIEVGSQTPMDVLGLPEIAMARGLTTYDASYLDLAVRLQLPLATTDRALRAAAESAGVSVVAPLVE